MKKYWCTAQHPFDSFRLWFIGTILLFILFLILGIDTNGIILWLAAVLSALLFNIILTLLRIVRVARKRNTIKISNLLRTEEIEAPYAVETWWMYEINERYEEYDSHYETWGRYESKPIANYLKLCANIKGKNGSILLCETIKMGGKFPNEHPYRYDLDPEDLKDAFDVWDVDNCLKSLRLSKVCLTSHILSTD